MKNIVTISSLRATPDMNLPTSGQSFKTYVLSSIATINQRMNQGMDIFFASLLNMSAVTSARGMIHRARVS